MEFGPIYLHTKLGHTNIQKERETERQSDRQKLVRKYKLDTERNRDAERQRERVLRCTANMKNLTPVRCTQET